MIIRIFCQIAAFGLTVSCFSQKVEVDYSACQLMIDFIGQLKKSVDTGKLSYQLDTILRTKPYQVMFQHYNRPYRPNHLLPDVFKRMVLSLRFTSVYKKGENKRADDMLPFWKRFYDSTDLYQKNLKQLEAGNLGEIIQKSILLAQAWLPAGMKIPDFYFFIHPNGGSTAFAINDSQGYDFFQLPRDEKGNLLLQKLAANASHESHHLGLDVKQPALHSGKDSLAFRFLTLFIAEGTASKFVDNLPGGCVPKIDAKRKSNLEHEGELVWNEYSRTEQELFCEFVDDFRKVYDGVYSPDSLQSRFVYWLSGYKGRAYFIGSELYGALYNAYGKETVFEAMITPTKLFQLYNKAVQKRKLNCPVLPVWLVERFEMMVK